MTRPMMTSVLPRRQQRGYGENPMTETERMTRTTGRGSKITQASRAEERERERERGMMTLSFSSPKYTVFIGLQCQDLGTLGQGENRLKLTTREVKAATVVLTSEKGRPV